jgi:PKD repeat protein
LDNFVFDFGDSTPVIQSKKPIVKHKYKEPGKYPITVTVTDKRGKKNKDSVPVKIVDPKAPIAKVKSYPPVAKPLQEVTVDASESKDEKGDPIKDFKFDFGDGTPVLITNKPIAKHAYKEPGKYPITATVTDPNGLSNDATTIQTILPNPGSNNAGKDYTTIPNPKLQPRAPNAVLTTNPPTVKPKELVTADASKSRDQDNDPCVNFAFDFGDGTPVVVSNKPVVKHAYDYPGTYPVKCVVTDKNGLSSPATVHQRVAAPNGPMYDDDPNKGLKDTPNDKYGGLKDKGNNQKPNYDGKFNNKGNLGKDPFNPEKKHQSQPKPDEKEPEQPGLTPQEIGDEFRNVVSDGISKAIMDPNPSNTEQAKQLTDFLNKINPEFPGQLDPEAKLQFKKFKTGPLKPMAYKPPPKKGLPGLKAGTKAVHTVQNEVNLNITNPNLPDI